MNINFYIVRIFTKQQLFIVFFILTLFFTIAKSSYAGGWVWSKETGWVEPDELPKETTDQQYKYAITLMVKKEYISAIGLLKDIIKKQPKSELAVEAQLKIGEAYYLFGDYDSAFKVYEKIIEQDPGSRRLKGLLEKEFQVGVAQMKRDEKGAIKVFEQIIERNPLGFISTDAQIKIADAYYQMRKFEDAEGAYLRVLENYPNSEWIPYAQYRIPYCKMSSIRIQERNYELLSQARYGFEEFMANNPDGALVPITKEILVEIDITMARRDYETGMFYLRKKRPDAGAIYFESVVKDYPNTEWADLSKEKLEMLRNANAIK